ncbi:pickpocket protein 28-like [Anopheles merus]|uniref:pickpocket protein 28-like n=1 Tax=Anopheles merus TaxID=30066 RepID=UPI001BE3E235|nr:pickpocket protein 28-like [Anopheles merus]
MPTLSGRLRQSVQVEVFREYCANSSIHGVRYFDRDERTTCERFWWLVVFLLSMLGCGVMIYKTYVKWNQTPIIVTFSEKTTPVRDIYFPAITICPETKVHARTLNFTAEIEALLKDYNDNNATSDQESIEQLKAVAQLCNMMFHSNYEFLQYLNGTKDDVVGMLKNLSLSHHDTIQGCVYSNQFILCDDHLATTLTEEGLCYTFNMMPEEDIFRQTSLHTEYTYTEMWYPVPGHETVTEPMYARGAGLHAGLTLFLRQIKEDVDYMCTGFSQGYKLMIHDPGEYPQVSMRNMRIPFGHEISIALKPQMIVTSPSAADYSWEKRQCFFNHERHLRYFKIYNQENCELECLTNVTQAICGCVRFSMPRSNDTKVCPLSMFRCMYDVKWIVYDIDDPERPVNEKITAMVDRCNCLPACSSISYDVETTQTTLDLEKFLRVNRRRYYRPDKFYITTIAIYFKESYFITSKRSELYGWVDFLANCGGLLGLFMGVSILSLLELCYYITIRPFSVRKRLGRLDQRKANEVHNSLLAVVTKTE